MAELNKPTQLKLPFSAKDVEAMKTLLQLSHLPSAPPIPPNAPWELGIEHTYLQNLKRLLNEWSFEGFEKRMYKEDNYVVRMKDGQDELTVHFVWRRSGRKGAVPLLLLHGWPGTFFDFHKVIEPLVNPPNPGDAAFDVVVPSLPGFFLSTHPQREGWQLSDTARIFHRLMTEVLGYAKYAAQGGDWGSYILRIIGSLYPDAAPALLFNMFRCAPAASAQPGFVPSDFERRLLARREEFGETGRGYIEIQGTKPFTIGLAIGASPLSILAWIGEKFYAWSDPAHLDPRDVVDTVALYFLSGCFASSVVVYHQNKTLRNELSGDPAKWRVKSKIGYSGFPYEIGGAPRADIEAVGDVVFYKEHESGGHFPALDNPTAYVQDVKEFFGKYWPGDV